jgi:hypothetical protein
MKKNSVLLLTLLFPFVLFSQNVGIGTTTPTNRLHVNGNSPELALFNSSVNNMYIAFSENGNPRGYIGSFSGSPEDVDFGTYSGNPGKLHLVTNNATRLTITNAGNVGIGTVNPEQLFSVASGISIDQNNGNTGTVNNTLRFGSASGEAIGSKRTAGTNQYGLDFYTQSVLRMTINNIGQVGIGTNQPQQSLSIAGGMNIDQDNSSNGTLLNALTFGNNSQAGIASWRGSSPSIHNGLDFYTEGTRRLSILKQGGVVIDPLGLATGALNGPALYFGYPGGNYILNLDIVSEEGLQFWSRGDKKIHLRNDVEIWDNLKIQNGSLAVEGKGIVRSSNSDQLMIKTANVFVNTSINANSTIVFNFTWPDAFTGVPTAYVGNALAGSSNGWAEVVMSVAHLTTTGGTLFVFNPRNTVANPNYTISIIGIGAE